MSSQSVTFAGAPLLTAVLAGACGQPSTTQAEELPPLTTVESVDLERYVGTWFEIASYPQRFQQGCTATTATYEPHSSGRIRVINRCRKDGLDGKLDEARGWARVVDESTKAKLEVSFFRPFWGDYWIIDLDEDYTYAVVGHPGRDYLWILAREPQLSDAVYTGIVERLEQKHYDTARLVKTLQPSPNDDAS